MEERGHPQTNDLERHQSARPRQPRQMRRREAGRQEFMDSNTGEESAGRQLCSGGGAEGGGGGGGGGCVRLADTLVPAGTGKLVGGAGELWQDRKSYAKRLISTCCSIMYCVFHTYLSYTADIQMK